MSDNWEDDKESEDIEQDDELDEDETSELAKEFKALCEDVQSQIRVKLIEADKALREAQGIAEKYGVPFSAGVSPLSNTYIPMSFVNSKFKELDAEELCDISGVYGDDMSDLFGYGGWLHSQVGC